ncbi:MAG: flagellar basal body P-ring formation protein FlgA [Alphaproteobacteria bacterium]|jgi:flagella basal body P-ring formation protein FlgA|nr:flagellar basal body P-ring formation protein FlgA [Alphaproteobacteria bacterium]
MKRFVLLICLWAAPLAAQEATMTVVAARTIPAKSVIGPDDLLLREVSTLGAVRDPDQIIGMEARVALYAGRPIRSADIGPPAVVERNQIVALIYAQNGLVIRTEGRALDRAGPGDLIRVMNVMSRQTVRAVIDEEGIAHVTN